MSSSQKNNLNELDLTHRHRARGSRVEYTYTKLPPWGGGQESISSSHSSSLGMTADQTSLFNTGPLNSSLLIYAAANGLGFLISLLTGSHLHLNLIGTGGAFALGTITTLLSSALTRVKLSSAAVTLWGTKLVGFLFFRALKVKHDGRLDGILSTVTGQCECEYSIAPFIAPQKSLGTHIICFTKLGSGQFPSSGQSYVPLHIRYEVHHPYQETRSHYR